MLLMLPSRHYRKQRWYKCQLKGLIMLKGFQQRQSNGCHNKVVWHIGHKQYYVLKDSWITRPVVRSQLIRWLPFNNAIKNHFQGERLQIILFSTSCTNFKTKQRFNLCKIVIISICGAFENNLGHVCLFPATTIKLMLTFDVIPHESKREIELKLLFGKNEVFVSERTKVPLLGL